MTQSPEHGGSRARLPRVRCRSRPLRPIAASPAIRNNGAGGNALGCETKRNSNARTRLVFLSLFFSFLASTVYECIGNRKSIGSLSVRVGGQLKVSGEQSWLCLSQGCTSKIERLEFLCYLFIYLFLSFLASASATCEHITPSPTRCSGLHGCPWMIKFSQSDTDSSCHFHKQHSDWELSGDTFVERLKNTFGHMIWLFTLDKKKKRENVKGRRQLVIKKK